LEEREGPTKGGTREYPAHEKGKKVEKEKGPALETHEHVNPCTQVVVVKDVKKNAAALRERDVDFNSTPPKKVHSPRPPGERRGGEKGS